MLGKGTNGDRLRPTNVFHQRYIKHQRLLTEGLPPDSAWLPLRASPWPGQATGPRSQQSPGSRCPLSGDTEACTKRCNSNPGLGHLHMSEGWFLQQVPCTEKDRGLQNAKGRPHPPPQASHKEDLRFKQEGASAMALGPSQDFVITEKTTLGAATGP
ncbi:hypothetical protein H8959_013992 [Pygathrix nigripes]